MIGTSARGGSSAGPSWCRRAAVTALPGLWVLGVVVWERVGGGGMPQLLVATPAIACAVGGPRQCLSSGAVSALLTLVPLGGGAGHPASDVRYGSCCAVLVVVAACCLATGRRLRLDRELARAREVAVAAQGVVLRPLPARLDGIEMAGGHLSASHGAAVGGDLYEALATVHGVRVVMGDVRGHGLDAIGTVAAVLGSFREAAHDEPCLGGVMRRLERALQRHLRERARAEHPAACAADPPHPVAEEFVTVLLLEVGRNGAVTALNCGHPWPYRLSGMSRGGARARQLAPGEAMPPLGPFPLPAELPVARCPRLLPGDALVLHTDGAEDARDAYGRFFPLERALADTVGRGPVVPTVVVEGVRRAVLRHTDSRLADDIALMVLRNDRGRPRPSAAPVHPESIASH